MGGSSLMRMWVPSFFNLAKGGTIRLSASTLVQYSGYSNNYRNKSHWQINFPYFTWQSSTSSLSLDTLSLSSSDMSTPNVFFLLFILFTYSLLFLFSSILYITYLLFRYLTYLLSFSFSANHFSSSTVEPLVDHLITHSISVIWGLLSPLFHYFGFWILLDTWNELLACVIRIWWLRIFIF